MDNKKLVVDYKDDSMNIHTTDGVITIRLIGGGKLESIRDTQKILSDISFHKQRLVELEQELIAFNETNVGYSSF